LVYRSSVSSITGESIFVHLAHFKAEEYKSLSAFQRLDREDNLFSTFVVAEAPKAINIDGPARLRALSLRYRGFAETFEVNSYSDVLF